MAANRSAWTIEAAIALAGDEPAATILEAEQTIRAHLAPAPVEDVARKEWEAALDERLRRLAVKIAPGMSVAQGQQWRLVMVESLSDLPAVIVLTAAKRAIHRPMQYLNEVEGIVREIAGDMVATRKLALMRLAALREAIERASEPSLPPPAEEPWTEAMVDEANDRFRRLGISTRFRLVDGAVESYRADPDEREAERRRAA
ncbi:MAG: hypothetical protein KAY22_12455 [Rhizorhabdus sp.]|uniref:hypothetical protein n=1 Tax=Rhizorhabdus sp. TaxID=1968843 RepID=UPI001B6DB87D|nr:hypothetical protein [Rhizorhabdus sp.]MBP8233110.1 hypothetical protein [Rhizorhabdus sp.]